MQNNPAEASSFSAEDAFFMARALRLAEKGQFSTSPNPMVGCVIVSAPKSPNAPLEQAILGEGYHKKAGTEHAEIHALNQLRNNGFSAQGASVYVTLEPCSHFGRTAPCALALIEAKVERVVIACLDQNPEVAGKGVRLLEDAGITVEHGLMSDTAEKLNQAFFKRMRTGRPNVVVKLAASLDGKTALENGESQWITSAQARQDVQRERALSCAILSGSGTALYDNPRLNVRTDELREQDAEAFLLRGEQPIRVIIDGKNQINNSLTLISDEQATLIYNTQQNLNLQGNNNQQIQINTNKDERHIDLARMLDDLGAKQINRLWVEAGAKLAGALLDAGLVDELVLYIAPKLLGGNARELLATATKNSLQDAIIGRISSVKQVGEDLKLVYTIDRDNQSA